MKVQISVGGKFHAFDLAAQLERYHVLHSLLTSYPRHLVEPYGIARQHIRSLPAKEVVQRLWGLLPGIFKRFVNPYPFLHELYDRAAQKYIEPCDLFVGFSSFALHSLDRAKKLGAKVIIERGGSHIKYQRDILRDEYARTGIDLRNIHDLDPYLMEKELCEYERCDAISVPSLFAAKSFVAEGIPRGKLIHIPYGVDLRMFNRTKKRDDVFRVIFAGGLILRKGVHYLMKAFAELNLPHAELLLIGPVSDEMRPYLRRYAGFYRRCDYFPLSKLADTYSQGSVFALLSIEDGFGLVLLQAQACGLPIIATDHTGAPDIVREGVDGFIIPIRDVEACKEKLLYLYEHPDVCEQMGENARTRVSEGFTWDDYGDKIVQEYERILTTQK